MGSISLASGINSSTESATIIPATAAMIAAMTTGEIMLPRINHARTPPEFQPVRKSPPTELRYVLTPLPRKPGLQPPDLQEYCATLRLAIPNPSSVLLLAVTKVAIPSGKLCRLMPRVSRMAVRLIDFGNGCTDFALNPADAHVATCGPDQNSQADRR